MLCYRIAPRHKTVVPTGSQAFAVVWIAHAINHVTRNGWVCRPTLSDTLQYRKQLLTISCGSRWAVPQRNTEPRAKQRLIQPRLSFLV